MKKILFIAVLMIMNISTVSATEKADTLKVDNTKIEKVIEDKTTNTKGKPVVNYYILYTKQPQFSSIDFLLLPKHIACQCVLCSIK